MNFDLDGIDTKTLSDSGVKMQVMKFGTSEPLKARNGGLVMLTVRGPDSDTYRQYTRAQVNKRLQRQADERKAREVDFDEVDTDSLTLLVNSTMGWENVLDTDGNPIPFTKENCTALYRNYPVLREQVDAFISNRANFLKASSAN
ncbi:hypothetical protein UFOVP119_82 [uncultured Caudovirales phage]|uniref:Uncharacterized protein n=1 Tax=uncultured Caudovirales phage TaxID=2100421 RepID=A0A6J5L7A1_9CAUD|nr:hypothetical protein UFOVP119_82 [uncultured Caudovirales phage]